MLVRTKIGEYFRCTQRNTHICSRVVPEKPLNELANTRMLPHKISLLVLSHLLIFKSTLSFPFKSHRRASVYFLVSDSNIIFTHTLQTPITRRNILYLLPNKIFGICTILLSIYCELVYYNYILVVCYFSCFFSHTFELLNLPEL